MTLTTSPMPTTPVAHRPAPPDPPGDGRWRSGRGGAPITVQSMTTTVPLGLRKRGLDSGSYVNCPGCCAISGRGGAAGKARRG
jgi:hypothetical protein